MKEYKIINHYANYDKGNEESLNRMSKYGYTFVCVLDKDKWLLEKEI